MLDKPLHNPTTKLLQSLKTLGSYARHPSGMAVIGSIALHGVVALALPSWSTSQGGNSEKTPEVVRVVALPDNVQDRLPQTSLPIDLSVFENDPNFNLDLSGLNRGAIAQDPNGIPLDPNGNYIIGMNNLPTPMAPRAGQTNYSFVPLSPPPIASRYSGFAPPPPPMLRGFLPPPPSFPSGSGSPNFSTANLTPPPANIFAPVPAPSNGGNQQEFTITPKPNSSVLQQQRQLEQQAAIALNPQAANPRDPNIRFNAELLKPSELRNQTNPDTAPTPPQQLARNTATISRSIAGNYPKGACSSQASGTAVYDVAVTPQGTPSQWSLTQSSGTSVLDNQASQDIRNTRFDGSNSNYRVNVGYKYQPAFCAAFTPKPAPAPAPKPAPVTAPAPTTAQPPAPPVVAPKTPEPPVAEPKPAPEATTLTIPVTEPTEDSPAE